MLPFTQPQDSLADLDDCLTMLFLFSTFPNIKVVSERILRQCRRLTVEFMHFVIHAKALRKVFVSIKGGEKSVFREMGNLGNEVALKQKFSIRFTLENKSMILRAI